MKTQTSTQMQRKRLLEALREAGSNGLTTLQIRETLDVMHAGGMIMELRCHGYDIRTIDVNAQGHPHRVARYVLMRERVAA